MAQNKHSHSKKEELVHSRKAQSKARPTPSTENTKCCNFSIAPGAWGRITWVPMELHSLFLQFRVL